MKKNEDLRIIKTKSSLINAFFDMLSTMSMDDITVNELCARAGIRRATFYKHFDDKTDFLAFLMKNVRDQFDNSFRAEKRSMNTKEYHISYISALISFFMRYEVAMMKILASPMRSLVINVFSEQNFRDTRTRLIEIERSGYGLPVSVDVMAAMLTGGVAENIVRWFESENRIPVEELKSEISKFIDLIFAA